MRNEYTDIFTVDNPPPYPARWDWRPIYVPTGIWKRYVHGLTEEVGGWDMVLQVWHDKRGWIDCPDFGRPREAGEVTITKEKKNEKQFPQD